MENPPKDRQQSQESPTLFVMATLNPENFQIDIKWSTPNLGVALWMARTLVDEFEHRMRLLFVQADKERIALARNLTEIPPLKH